MKPTWRDVITAWETDAAARSHLAREIADSPHEAVFWECTPVSRASLDTPFEMVLLPARALASAHPDASSFTAHLECTDSAICSFDNLGGDARLVVPRDLSPTTTYTHLAAFLRTAPPHQVDALFRVVGHQLAQRLAQTDQRVWVSTSGLGVPWLHVRLDATPKYFQHAPFRRPPHP